ncbi:hypothetical protein NQ318_011248 [Aromia moschata]|uniref:Maturase K n=1 Tax=Aromia moschata TaxID=1265417 RepID=A0AAV8YHD9_9CUCU|nr:hypothetical protein NQ318_011248 [Aromia moschata]
MVFWKRKFYQNLTMSFSSPFAMPLGGKTSGFVSSKTSRRILRKFEKFSFDSVIRFWQLRHPAYGHVIILFVENRVSHTWHGISGSFSSLKKSFRDPVRTSTSLQNSFRMSSRPLSTSKRIFCMVARLPEVLYSPRLVMFSGRSISSIVLRMKRGTPFSTL